MRYDKRTNRIISDNSRFAAAAEYEREKRKPTYKQLKFYMKLYYMCKDNGIDVKLERHETRTRMYMAQTIDKLIELLNENGIEIHGNGKSFHSEVSYMPFGNGFRSTERIVIDKENGENERTD